MMHDPDPEDDISEDGISEGLFRHPSPGYEIISMMYDPEDDISKDGISEGCISTSISRVRDNQYDT